MNKKLGWKGSRFESEKGGGTDRRVFNIKLLDGYYCSVDYELGFNGSSEITKEGLLLLGKLEPKVSAFPEFSIRWDTKKQELDIDIHGNSKHKKDWENSKNGYEGHHTEKLTNGGRKFKILIKIPQFKVFEGEIKFNLEINEELREIIKVHDDAIVVFNPPIKPP